MKKPKTATEAAAHAAAYIGLGPTLGALAINYFSDDVDMSGVAESQLQEFALRGRLDAEINAAKARTAQEFSLAQRILTATEVEIEEFYEGTGEGGVGLKADATTKTLTAGLHGSGSKVTRRVIRLSGWPDGQTAIEAVLTLPDE